ncbi:putative 54S ribosomal protein L17, mitochondrial [Tothia fuscella]|uniref:Large ribosomal subunit protein mL46 n=1 Tax=Tothia fuscella TaxID=1048955 RepID=A0A9P4TV13_9PEZI|nr:putative 54S ribosomal protein L17, mitochondrial [Tothia fuscella]
MSAPKNSLKFLLGGNGRPINSSICRSCRKSISSRRQYASTAAAVAEAPESIHSPVTSSSPSTQLAYALRAGVVLSRPPQITRTLTPFEKSFFLYQKRLNERLSLPFTRYFYYRKGTPSEIDYKAKIKSRLTPARDIGRYNPYLDDGWNDEVLVGAQESEPEDVMEKLLGDVEVPVVNKFQGEQEQEKGRGDAVAARPAARETEADRTGDLRSLDRALERTLYLVVRDGKGRWGFPSDVLVGKESLHLAAERILVQTGGINMNTWVVGNAPVGYHEHKYPKYVAKGGVSQIGEKTFFMKARIMAGQANLEGNKLGVEDFQWLAKEEIPKVVDSFYWSQTRNMLSAR